MTGVKPCKLQDCSRPRYANLSICRTHFWEKQKLNREEKAKKKLERKTSSKKFQKSELKKWKAKTWKLMSEWVRRKDSTHRGYEECFTCLRPFYWTELHAGHYQHGKLDYSEDNIKPQCAACNTYHGGRLDSYTLRLISEHGVQWVEDLKRRAAQHPGYQLHELKIIHAELKEKLSKL